MTDDYRENPCPRGEFPQVIKDLHIGNLVDFIVEEEGKTGHAGGYVTAIKSEKKNDKLICLIDLSVIEPLEESNIEPIPIPAHIVKDYWIIKK